MKPDAQPVTQEPPPVAVPTDAPAYRWYHKIWAVLLIAFCLEIGLFLLGFPWTEYWQSNYFSNLTAGWRHVWLSTYFRGALSGLGIINLCIAFVEIFRLRRFVKRRS